MLDLTPQVNLLADHVHALRTGKPRVVVALAGPPAAGKSTLARELARRLIAQKCPAQIIGLDGFHLDNGLLAERGLTARKGAPESFDAEGFRALIARVAAGENVVFPVFDRDRDLSLAGAGAVPADCPVVIVEGNYLLFDAPLWRDLVRFWDMSVWLAPAEDDLRARLIHRWLRQNFTRAAAVRRAEDNDLPNARRVIAHALPADITL